MFIKFLFFPFPKRGVFQGPPPLSLSHLTHENWVHKFPLILAWLIKTKTNLLLNDQTELGNGFFHKGTTITLRGRLFVTLGPRFFAQLSFLTSLEFRTLTFFDRISNGNSCTIQSWQKIRYEPKNIAKTLP